MSTKTISLDFYNHNIEYLKAKQSDTGRNVKIVCTDHGKKVFLDSSTVSAFIKYKKSDGNFVFNKGIIQTDGTILVELTAQMLAITGRHVLEVIIVNSTGLKVDELSEIYGYEDLGVSLISTMPFYVNVVASALDDSNVTSLSEYSALTSTLATMTAIDTTIRTLHKDVSDAEALRVRAEKGRVDAEDERVQAELKRQDHITGEAYRQNEERKRQETEELHKKAEAGRVTAEETRVAFETARVEAESLRVEAEDNRVITFNSKIEDYDKTISNKLIEYDGAIYNKINGENGYNSMVDTVVSRGEDLITDIENAVDSGAIYQSEKGATNGVATLNENGIIPNNQLPMVYTIENALQSAGYVFDAQVLATLINELKNVDSELNNKMIESTDYPGCFYRVVNGEIEWINPPMIDAVTYKTTKRHFGKPVYVQCGNGGVLANNDSKTLALGNSGDNIDHIVVLELEAVSSEGIVNQIPFHESEGNIRAVWYKTKTSTRSITIRTFSNISDYTVYWYVEYTLK